MSDPSVDDLLRRWRGSTGRLLVCGTPGTDRAGMCSRLAQVMAGTVEEVLCLCADPALPAFGVPGALSLGRWRRQGWEVLQLAPLCSLDSARFRLPLVLAAASLLRGRDAPVVLVQAPGLAGGVAGEELLQGLVMAAAIDRVLLLHPPGAPLRFAVPLEAGPAVTTWAMAANPGRDKTARRAHRNRRWREYMSSPTAATLSLAGLQLLGTPPPLTAADAWRGRQVALLGEAGACTIGEVVALWEGRVELRLAAPAGSGNRLLLRDALSVHGELRSARPHRPPPETPPAAPQAHFLRDELSLTKAGSSGPVPVARIGSASAVLVNGVFGDPLLKLQLLHQRRNLLFDLGDPGRMAARVAHQVSDLFLSHTHADHIGGFMWFLRSRIGELPPCRCYGPPGIAAQIAGMVGGILWDRVAERAPRFEVREWHDDHLRCFSVVAGVGAAERLADLPLLEGVVWLEEGFRVRAARLDHRTPVLAYAWEPAARVRVRRERLEASGLRPGRWLQALKEAVLARRPGEVIVTPDGAAHRVAELQHRLLLVEPGGKLVYATDFADTPENRERLVALAAGAHSLFCEASFLLEDVAQARRTQHLTTRACAEIANAAGVAQLHPFHFSRRYMKRAADVYREIRCVCERTVVPAFRATEDSG